MFMFKYLYSQEIAKPVQRFSMYFTPFCPFSSIFYSHSMILKPEYDKSKIVVWGGLINTWGKKRSKRQRRKGKTYPSECRVPKIARRDEKAFLSDQCKEIEGNNRMGKTRDLFKKIRDTNRTFHANMGTINDKNSMGLTEAEDIKKKWQNTQRNYAKKLKNK